MLHVWHVFRHPLTPPNAGNYTSNMEPLGVKQIRCKHAPSPKKDTFHDDGYSKCQDNHMPTIVNMFSGFHELQWSIRYFGRNVHFVDIL